MGLLRVIYDKLFFLYSTLSYITLGLLSDPIDCVSNLAKHQVIVLLDPKINLKYVCLMDLVKKGENHKYRFLKLLRNISNITIFESKL